MSYKIIRISEESEYGYSENIPEKGQRFNGDLIVDVLEDKIIGLNYEYSYEKVNSIRLPSDYKEEKEFGKFWVEENQQNILLFLTEKSLNSYQ